MYFKIRLLAFSVPPACIIPIRHLAFSDSRSCIFQIHHLAVFRFNILHFSDPSSCIFRSAILHFSDPPFYVFQICHLAFSDWPSCIFQKSHSIFHIRHLAFFRKAIAFFISAILHFSNPPPGIFLICHLAFFRSAILQISHRAFSVQLSCIFQIRHLAFFRPDPRAADPGGQAQLWRNSGKYILRFLETIRYIFKEMEYYCYKKHYYLEEDNASYKRGWAVLEHISWDWFQNGNSDQPRGKWENGGVHFIREA